MDTSICEILQVCFVQAKRGELPVWRQLAEMSFLMLFHRIGPGYYLMARFWRRSIPFSVKRQHWNGKRYLRELHRINDPRYYKISQNKLVEKALLQTLGVPCVPLLGHFDPYAGQCAHGKPLRTESDLQRLLAGAAGRRVFFKPAEGDSGRGVFSLNVAVTGELVKLSRPIGDEECSIPQLVEILRKNWRGTVIEPAIEQDPALARLNATSVNTLRVWVASDGEEPRVLGAFLRVGRAGSEVDNTSRGGLACPVDLESGRLREAIDVSPMRRTYETHPDTGATLPGTEIPHWPQCVALAENALRVLPGAAFAGLDIAVSLAGPVLVEYNVEPDYRGAAHLDLPHGLAFRRTLGRHT